MALGQKNFMASWKSSGLVELDPKGKATRGYDGISVSNQTVTQFLEGHIKPNQKEVHTKFQLSLKDTICHTSFEMYYLNY